ncbi:MAG: hypothetical protein QGG40_06880 [Myxococcota bacterium]|jgi:hypothetical protein|nr:hypothetical protein [Myxococcota bacterium]
MTQARVQRVIAARLPGPDSVGWALTGSTLGVALFYGILAWFVVVGGLHAEPSTWPGYWSEGALKAIWLADTASSQETLLPTELYARIFAPIGVSLVELADGDWLPYRLAGYVVHGVGLEAGYALVVGFVLWTNALAARVLARQVTPVHSVATLCGALVLLQPLILGRLELGDLPSAWIAMPALAVAGMLRVWSRGGGFTSIGAGMSMALCYAICWQSSLLVVSICVGIALWPNRGIEWTSSVFYRLVTLFVAGVGLVFVHKAGLGLAVPAWVPGAPNLAGSGPEILLRFLAGPGFGYVLGGLFAWPPVESLGLLLFVGLGLARVRGSWPWWILFLLIVTAAAGPALETRHGLVPLPMTLLFGLFPPLVRVAEPARWLVMALLPAVALASIGLTHLLERHGVRSRGRTGWVLVCTAVGIVVAIGAGKAPLPRLSLDLSTSEASFTSLTVEQDTVLYRVQGGAVVLPVRSSTASLAWQLAHPNVPVFSGPRRSWMFVAPQTWLSFAESNPFLMVMTGLTQETRPFTRTDIEDLWQRGIGQIVVDRQVLVGEDSDKLADALIDEVGLAMGDPVYSDGSLTIFSVQ